MRPKQQDILDTLRRLNSPYYIKEKWQKVFFYTRTDQNPEEIEKHTAVVGFFICEFLFTTLEYRFSMFKYIIETIVW